jgi:small subunit ribosomal protein S4
MAKLSKKCRLCRREGEKLFLKGERCHTGKCPIDKKGAVPPGQHGIKNFRRLSSYGQQLREKQKIKRVYGVLEKQFRRLYKQAEKRKGDTGFILLQLLESRLDNVLYRLGLVPSRTFARQIITHGHVTVNGQKVTIPSYLVKLDDQVTFDPKIAKMTQVLSWIKEKRIKTPSWLDKKAIVGKVVGLPERKEIDENLNESLIVEFYSK